MSTRFNFGTKQQVAEVKTIEPLDLSVQLGKNALAFVDGEWKIRSSNTEGLEDDVVVLQTELAKLVC